MGSLSGMAHAGSPLSTSSGEWVVFGWAESELCLGIFTPHTQRPSSTIHPFRAFLISRHASPSPAFAPPFPPARAFAFALAAEGLPPPSPGVAHSNRDNNSSREDNSQQVTNKPYWLTRNEGGGRAIMLLSDDRGIILMRRLSMLDVGGPNGTGNGNGNASSPSAASPGASGGGIMSNGLPDPDSQLTPVDVLNGLNNPNPSANGLNGTPTRKDSLGEEGVGQQQGGDGGVVKANKGMILRKSVEYIRYLQQLVTAQGARNRELEQELKTYRRRSRSSSSMEPPLSDSTPTAGGDGSNMILHDELHHFHHGHGHMGRLPSMPEEGGDDGDDLMMGLEDDMGLGGMGMGKGSLSPDSMEGEREEQGGEGLVEERGRTRGVRGLKAEVQSDDSLLGM
ncbi:uncharacterized protein LACBIDRAFT_294581 [Laccaria bicolor S238N-H82]|uniref:Predicted protein n=1 Tax=Laccaria bicolor (strain S238N-H82 / ATCC MYA-4686) TaxID=486041 RepID=B0DEH9_LACBS|nr:uncharacterized protein LACBIDRAFT_294581 [Laccaria bicolor S238N-H82]EDR06938.1 predicted protein [Laccaria bicolor S238N-H82]|eukprot:XP_001882311.1 predicted protein [Laccaria bicolor S238N-H82]